MVDDFLPKKTSKPTDDPEETLSAPKEEPVHTYDKTIETVELGDEPNSPSTEGENKTTKRHPLAWIGQKWRNLSKKKKILTVIIAIIVIAAGTGAVLALASHHSPKITIKESVPAKIVPHTSVKLVSKLTGLPISSPSVNQRPVTAVIIENSLAARPQSGLDQAGIVFEAIAEAGITRFLALYQDTQPSYLGPVRSARPYFIEWSMGFDAPLAHVGGSPEALNDIQNWGIRDLDQSYNASAYERIASRQAPHNVYTSATQLNALEASKGFTSSTFTGFPRKPDSPSKSPNATSIDINPSTADYESHYDYDAATDSYKRSEGGQPHMEIDANGNQTQITPKVVIAMVMQYSLEADNYHSQYNVIGSGQVYVFQDGTVTTGTWQKTSDTSQITFTNDNGQPIKLNAGQTWITAVGSASDVSYKS